MSRYRICVYAICKNEEKFVESWFDSMSEADHIVVIDTGSTDNTVEKLRERGATVFVEEVKPWRFDVARNLSLDHVPQDVDICVCTDLDELLEPGWRKKLEAFWQPDATMGNYLYNWSLRPDGTPHTQFVYFKVHSRNDYRWQYPAHECLEYIGKRPQKKVFIPGMVLNHYPDAAKSRGSYLSLLELGAREMPEDSRMAYYLGREYMYSRRWKDCIREMERYLTLSAWKEERCAAMRWIAKSYIGLGDVELAFAWYHRAIAELPGMRDAYVEMAQLAYQQKDWPATFWACEHALRIGEKSAAFTNAGYAWDHTPYDLAAIACYRLGMLPAALDYAKKALAISPDDARLQTNLLLIEQAAGSGN